MHIDDPTSNRVGPLPRSTIPALNVVPDHETADYRGAASRAMLDDADNLEFTSFLPFSGRSRWRHLDGISNPVQPKDWGPCSESLFFVVKINRGTGKIST